jgi:uncharacterized SAM-binding protein YcdF (DUF218 family)
MIISFCCLLFFIYKLVLLWPLRQQRDKRWWFGLATAVLALSGIIFGLMTDIVAQKALGLLLMPTGFIWILISLLAGLLWWMRHQRFALLASFIWLCYTIAGNSWVSDALILSLERQIPVVDMTTMEPLQAVFLLGGGTDFSVNGPSLGDSGDRVIYAAQIYHAGKTPLLISSGSSISEISGDRDLAQDTAVIWRSLSVPEANIMTLPPGLTITRAEITAYDKLVREHGWTRVGLVSSAWHLPRALRQCERLKFHPIPIGADRRGNVQSWSLYRLIPKASNLVNAQTACWEYLGILAGR